MTSLITKVLILVSIGWFIVLLYPRHIALTLKGVEYRLGSPKQGVKPIVLQLNGTLHRSLWGKRSFDGKVNIKGSTIPNKDNGKTLKIVFNPVLGGEIIYFNWKTRKFYMYGSLYANKNLTAFTVLEYKHASKGSGWSGGDGLIISAPAKTRAQALQIANHLMKARLLPGHPLK